MPDDLADDLAALPFAQVSSRYSSRKYPLHALTILSGHNREMGTEYYNKGNRRDLSYYTVWQYTISGRGRIDTANRSQELLPGSLMLAAVPGDHVYYLPGDSEHWEFVFLVMTGRDAMRAVKTVENYRGNVLDAGETPQTMKHYRDFLQDLVAQKVTSPFDNSSRSYGLCMSLIEESGKAWDFREKQSFGELLSLIQHNLYRDISVEEMAAATQLSRSHFTRLFSTAMGQSPRKYLEELRLKTALDILCSEKLPVKEAAFRVGIYDVNYFCRVFKKRYGLPPGKYRELNLKGLPQNQANVKNLQKIII
ncbi:MAG: AraC family transcriptional regulator [Treponema sp.]|jgi:AraC-like DNA-binding protein|nr:AraC family transcriptional regulator [Treponema sp.]